MHARFRQTQNERLKTREELELGPLGANNDDDNQGGHMPSWMFKEESNRGETKNRDPKKKPAQIKKNDNHATQDVKVDEGTTKGKCDAGPCLTRVGVGKPIIRENYVGKIKRQKIERSSN